VLVFDPVLSEAEVEYLEQTFHWQVLLVNEVRCAPSVSSVECHVRAHEHGPWQRCKRAALKPTWFYMPHCERVRRSLSLSVATLPTRRNVLTLSRTLDACRPCISMSYEPIPSPPPCCIEWS